MSQPVVFSCPNCRSILSVPAHPAGTTGPCPVCGITIAAPDEFSEGSDLPDLIDPLDLSDLSDPSDATPATPESPDTPPVPETPPRPSSSLGRWISLFILLGAVGAAMWFSRDAIFPGFLAKSYTKNDAAPAHPATTKPSGELPHLPAPAPEITEPVPPVAPQPPAAVSVVPPPVPSPDAPAAPPPSLAAPSPTEVPPPPPPTAPPPLPSPGTTVARGVKDAVDTFLRENTPEARLPLLFSSRWSPEELAGQLVNGRLSRLPAMEYKAVVHVSKPGGGIRHFYVAVKPTEADGQSPARELLLHLTNQGGAGFRINADALVFHLENPIPGYLATPAEEPLPAWVFIERGRFLGEDDPGNRLCLNLRMGPFTPVIGQALLEPDSPLVPAINPWVAWGAPPKPVSLDLRHTKLGQLPVLTLGQQITAEWLPPPAP